MDPAEWFEEFLRSYRAIIDKLYSNKKAFFPYYGPVDVSIYLVEDPRKFLPEVVVFFQKEMEELPVTGAIGAWNKKINWPEDFDVFSPEDQDVYINIVYHESFDEFQYPGALFQEAFSRQIFSSKPGAQAEIMVQRQLIKGLQKDSFRDYLRVTEIRKQQLGKHGIGLFLSRLSQLPKLSEEEKADVISNAFWVLGFETVNLERIKMLNEYKALNQAPHVDILAFLVQHKILVAIDEGKMNKERWYKNYTLPKTLDILKFLGTSEDWNSIIFLAIGRKSRGIDYLEGNVRVTSLDYFTETMQDFFEGKGGFPALNAIEKILGYKLQFFWK